MDDTIVWWKPNFDEEIVSNINAQAYMFIFLFDHVLNTRYTIVDGSESMTSVFTIALMLL